MCENQLMKPTTKTAGNEREIGIAEDNGTSMNGSQSCSCREMMQTTRVLRCLCALLNIEHVGFVLGWVWCCVLFLYDIM